MSEDSSFDKKLKSIVNKISNALLETMSDSLSKYKNRITREEGFDLAANILIVFNSNILSNMFTNFGFIMDHNDFMNEFNKILLKNINLCINRDMN